jgi:pyruvate formate lyase activating enzyme
MKSRSRRNFLKYSACALSIGAFKSAWAAPAVAPTEQNHEACDYRALPLKKVKCTRCPNECETENGKRGTCGVRENQNGKYYSLVYGRPVAANVDPIEKKPFFHFLPGHLAFSIGTVGCNFKCKFCQNYQISQARPEDVPSTFIRPDEVVKEALKNLCHSIAYTYNEPTVVAEFAEDCSQEGKKSGLKSEMVSNGFIQKAPLLRLCKTMDAIKIDLKSFSETYYRDICSGKLKPVLDTLTNLAKEKTWYEIVVLLIPTLNDTKIEISAMAKWIHSELGDDVPLHFSRFSPNYKLVNLLPTPIETLAMAYAEAKDAGLHYVYLGNVPGHRAENTFCHHCGKKVISRYGFMVKEMLVQKGKCSFCKQVIPGVWA